MTDYELYQILDENGYEPSAENLAYLKENMDILDEWYLTHKGMGKEISADKHRIDRINTALEDPNLSQRKRDKLHAELEKKTERLKKNNAKVADIAASDGTWRLKKISEGQTERDKKENETNKLVDKVRQSAKTHDNQGVVDHAQDIRDKWNKNRGTDTGAGFFKRLFTGQSEKTYNDTKKIKDIKAARSADEEKKKQNQTNPGDQTTTQEPQTQETLQESINILANLLESNGYEVSEENIIVLSESLLNDTCAILDSNDVVLTEGMDSDYIYMQLLDNNGFEVSEDNINVLKEALDNGHILLV